MTAPPVRDDDISIIISRFDDRHAAGTVLFLDIYCKQSPLGAELCKSERVRSIVTRFRIELGEDGSAAAP
jgi:hypothetical protein